MSSIYLRRTYMHDLPAISKVIAEAKALLKEAGSPQWQDGHPTRENLINDITHHQSWALIVNDQVAGVATLVPGPEKSYQKITGGAWHNDNDHYLTIHRVAISNAFRGHHLSSFLFSNLLTIGLERGYSDFRIDTHRKNQAMQKIAQNFGFKYRGIIQVDDKLDPERLAFELNLPTNKLPEGSHVDNNFMKPLTNQD